MYFIEHLPSLIVMQYGFMHTSLDACLILQAKIIVWFSLNATVFIENIWNSFISAYINTYKLLNYAKLINKCIYVSNWIIKDSLNTHGAKKNFAWTQFNISFDLVFSDLVL